MAEQVKKAHDDLGTDTAENYKFIVVGHDLRQKENRQLLCPDVKGKSKHETVSHCYIPDNPANISFPSYHNCEIWNCSYTNANNILTKMDELKDLVIKNKYHIIGVSESWAKN